jgi:hypothetical protein
LVAVVEKLTHIYLSPMLIRSDNGSKCIGHALKHWTEISSTTSAYIET